MDVVVLIGEVIVAIAAATGAIVAVIGLNAWRRQLRGKSDFELARRILVNLFKYRDAVGGVRHPAIWANEMPSPPESQRKTMSDAQIRFYGTSEGYQARWNKVTEVRADLYPDLLEAEAVWGGQLAQYFKVIHALQHELAVRIRVELEIRNPDTPEASKEAHLRIMQKERDIMYDLSTEDSPDVFKRDLIAAIANIEQYLKPKLIMGAV